MGQKLDLTNKVFGVIRCISPAPNIGDRTAWNCECIKCGAKKVIKTINITSGRTKSCGCGCTEQFLGKQRICVICGKPFELKEYGYTRKYCYECSDTNSVRERVNQYRHATKKALVEYKGGKCIRCGYNKCLNALQFHHLNPKEKDFNLSKSTKPFEELKKEVDKCILVCANCHAEIHAEEFGE